MKYEKKKFGMLHDFSRRQEKKMHTFKQTQSGIEVGLRFLLQGQKQSWGAQLNVFIVFLSAELGTREGFCYPAQAEAGSLTHTHTLDV